MVAVVATVRQGADRMRDARLAAADVHKRMLDAAEMTAGQAYDVGVTSSEVADGINAVASATEELNATISEVANHATFAAEVNELAQQTAEATEQVRSIVTGINESSERASVTIDQITATRETARAPQRIRSRATSGPAWPRSRS